MGFYDKYNRYNRIENADDLIKLKSCCETKDNEEVTDPRYLIRKSCRKEYLLFDPENKVIKSFSDFKDAESFCKSMKYKYKSV